MSDIFNPFDAALTEWKKRSTDQTFVKTIGNLYTLRYSSVIRSEAASAFRKSIYEESDEVHAFKADAVRRTIIERIMHSENRGYIRPWYTNVGFWAERTNILKAISEEDVDFILRGSLLPPEGSDDDTYLHKDLRKAILQKSDPIVPRLEDGSINEFVLGELRRDIDSYSRPVIELYASLKALIRLLFPLKPEEAKNVILMVFNSEEVDNFFRKRFISLEKDASEKERVLPLLGEGHNDIRYRGNFVLKYIAENNEEFFQHRTLLLWLFALFSENPVARDYITKNTYAIIPKLDSWLANSGDNDRLEGYFQLIYKGSELQKVITLLSSLLHILRTEYASKQAFSEYGSQIYHLLILREEVLKHFSEGNYPIPIETSKLEQEAILQQICIATIDSELNKFTNMIPTPKGVSNSRMILMKRKNNLHKSIAPMELQNNLKIAFASNVAQLFQTNKSQKSDINIENEIRKIHDALSPRGEKYFAEMKKRIEEDQNEFGDQKEELSNAMEHPQTFVKQYGFEAQRFMKSEIEINDPDLSDYFALMLSMKTSELLFDDATTSVLKRKSVTKSIFNDYYKPQLELVKYIKNKNIDDQETIIKEPNDESDNNRDSNTISTNSEP